MGLVGNGKVGSGKKITERNPKTTEYAKASYTRIACDARYTGPVAFTQGRWSTASLAMLRTFTSLAMFCTPVPLRFTQGRVHEAEDRLGVGKEGS